jgi:hypothetical protein
VPHYDLHSHTYYSDGELAPAELVARAKAAGVDALAVTDHDVTAGLAEAALAAAQVGLELIPGVEISVTWERQTLHVVGLHIDATHAPLQTGLAALRDCRNERAHEIGRRLAKKGIADAHAAAARFARGPILSRTHFARFLVDAGHARDLRQAFQRFLGKGTPGHVPSEWVALDEAVGWIRAAGGHAVIAHPARYKLSSNRLHRLLHQFKECGGTAIEVVSGSHSHDDCLRFARLATQVGLHASAGSDFHGPNTWMQLGRLPPLPDGCTPLWTRFGPSPALEKSEPLVILA